MQRDEERVLFLVASLVLGAACGTSAEDDATGPDDDTTAPDDDTTPSDDDSTAADDDTAPPDDDSAAADDDTAPPDDDSTAADDDTASPDDDTAPPDDDTTPPDDDSAAADDDSAAADDDTVTPDDDTGATDEDGDGVAPPIDCDDSDPEVHPGADDVCGDGVDADCSGDDSGCILAGPVSVDDARITFLGSPSEGAWAMSAIHAGDLDGDGRGDLVVADPTFANEVGEQIGAAFVFLGPLSGRLSLDDADARVVGEDAAYPVGSVLAPAGDLNADGRDDLLVGSGFNVVDWEEVGRAYLFHGPLEGDVPVSHATATIPCEGVGGFDSRAPARGAGDVDGDGFDDVVVSRHPDGLALDVALLFKGPLSGSLGSSDASTTFVVDGWVNGPQTVASGAGDVDGDGLADVLVGSSWGAYLFRAPYMAEMTSDDAVASFTWADGLGYVQTLAPSPAGNTNGDGYDDFLVVSLRTPWLVAGVTDSVASLFLGPQSGPHDMEEAHASWRSDPAAAAISAAHGGDLDGDGFADLVLTTWGTGPAERPATYVIYGPAAPGSWSLDDADVVVRGEHADHYTAAYTSAGGDTTGDGRDDLVVASPMYPTYGIVHVMDEPFPGITLGDAAASLTGVWPGDAAGASLAVGADLTGAGAACLVIGGWTAGGAGGEAVGRIWIAPAPLPPGAIDVSALTAIEGTGAHDFAGYSLAVIGDATGDGLADLLVGAPNAGPEEVGTGAAYLVPGPILAPASLADVGLALWGEGAGDSAGHAVAGAGDVDGDGLDDLLIGAPSADGGATDAGAAYLVPGPVAASGTLADAAAVLLGPTEGARAGYAVAGVGDVDGDGFRDLVVGAPGASEYDGAAFLLLGPVSGTISLAAADGRIGGEPGAATTFGRVVAAAGDADGDGRADVWVGDSGSLYLFLGPATGDLTPASAQAKLTGAGRPAVAATVPDLDGDGLPELFAGTSDYPEGALDPEGAAWLLYGPFSGVRELDEVGVGFLGPGTGAGMGAALAASSDLDGDGVPDLVIGAPGRFYGTTWVGSGIPGAVYVFPSR
ncbi:FG-GAP-like repeat-containing protein [Myxococcota bacterium]|nr:FG-GAP-like repeat-containing protein [Myxococcota bacterium]